VSWWLTFSHAAALSSATTLFLLHLYLFFQERQRYIGLWAAAWLFGALRNIPALWHGTQNLAAPLVIGQQGACLLHGLLLAWGTSIFFGKGLRRLWIGTSVAGLTWILLAVWQGFPRWVLTLPTFSLLAGTFAVIGIVFLRSFRPLGLGASLAGWGFLAWSALDMTYPFCSQYPQIAQWGYFLSAILSLAVAGGTMMVYYQKTKLGLAASEKRFRTLADMAPVGILLTNADGECQFANRRWCEITGLVPDEAAGCGWLRALHEEDARGVVEQWFQVEPGERILNRECRLKTPDGKTTWISGSAVALHDDHSHLTGHLVTVTDITDRKESEEQLRRLASELSLAEDRERRRLAADLHDHIGQNLAAARIGLSELAASDDTVKASPTLDRIGQLLAETVRATRSLTFQLSPPVLHELGLEAAVAWLVEDIRERYGIAATLRDDGSPKPLDDNLRATLFRAVRELIVNAGKHAKAHHIRVSIERIDSHIRVSVEDDGAGFDVAAVERRRGGLTGFGLFSIRERLAYLGGRMEVWSEVGHGTRVCLSAPLKEPVESVASEEPAPRQIN